MFKRLLKKGINAEDDEDMMTRKKFLIYLSLFSMAGALVWGGISALYGLYLPALIPLCYLLISLVNLGYLNKTGDFRLAKAYQLASLITLPFLFQWSLGGFLASGFVMLWSILALVAVISLFSLRHVLYWIAVFAFLTVLTGVFDDTFKEYFKPDILPDFSLTFAVLNICMVTIGTGVLVAYYVEQLRSAQNELQEKQKEMEEINFSLLNIQQQLKESNRVLTESNDKKTQFLNTISHEIKTPLNGIIGTTGLLAGTFLNPEQEKLVKALTVSNSTLQNIVNDVLDLGQIEAGEVALNITSFNLEKELRSLASTYASQLNERKQDVSLKIRLDNKLPEMVRTDCKRLLRVLACLLNNAVNYTVQGHVLLQVQTREIRNGEATLEFRVEDTGIGIKKENMHLLFTRFFRADEVHTNGTGLGLNVASKLVKLFGSRLQVRSVHGKGSQFSFRVTMKTEESESSLVAMREGARVKKEALRILVAEDNPVNQMIATKILKNIGCRHITVVDNGRKALNAALSSEFDLILMDINMPEMDGLEATCRILEQLSKSGSRLPVIGALTANALDHEVRTYFNSGMQFVLSKPFKQPELEEEIMNCLRSISLSGNRNTIRASA